MTRRTASGKFRPSLLQRLSPSVDTREFLHKGNAALANLLEDWRELKVHFLSPGLSLATVCYWASVSGLVSTPALLGVRSKTGGCRFDSCRACRAKSKHDLALCFPQDRDPPSPVGLTVA